MKLISCAVLLLAVLGSALAYKTYAGYQVLQTGPLNDGVQLYISKMENDPRFDFWSRPRNGGEATIMTAPEHVEDLRAMLRDLGLTPTTLINDVAPIVQKERDEQEAIKRTETKAPKAVTFDRFMTFDEIMEYQHEVAAANPSIASIVDVATSFEGRPVHALKISGGGSGKKIVWFDCNIHAREWASAPQCMRIIEEVIASTELQNLVDWYILPVANPDGYSYSHTDERFWRKTRRPNPGSSCVGTDPNRNFEWMWNDSGNTNECSETYPGPNVYSESECKGVADMVKSLNSGGDLVLYMTIHSYATEFYFPLGTQAAPVPEDAALQAAGDAAVDAIFAVSGTRYRAYSETNPGAFIFGAMDDFAFKAGNVKYSYTMELPGGGSGGFNPPASYIKPTCDETWAGLQAMVRHILAA